MVTFAGRSAVTVAVGSLREETTNGIDLGWESPRSQTTRVIAMTGPGDTILKAQLARDPSIRVANLDDGVVASMCMGRATPGSFTSLKCHLAYEQPRPASARPTLAELRDTWEFFNDNLDPAELITLLLHQAARRFPFRVMRYTELAAFTFNLRREPTSRDAHVAAVKKHLSRADRRLHKLHGRRILRLGKCVRASINEDDWRAVIAPRRLRRLQGAVRKLVRTARAIDPSKLSPNLRTDYFASLRELPGDSLTDPDDRAWLEMMLKRGGGRKPS